MAMRLLLRAATKRPSSNAASGQCRGTLRVFSRGLMDDLSSLLDENLKKTLKSEEKPRKATSEQEMPESKLPRRRRMEAQRGKPPVEVEKEDEKPTVELLPEFASDEELIEYVTGILMTTNWRELRGMLAPLGDQVKGRHVPEILKRAQHSSLVFSFFRWARARKHIEDHDPTLLQLMFVILSNTKNPNFAEEMQWLIQEMHAKGLRLENSMFVEVMENYARLKRVLDARRLFFKMERLDCSPKTPTYNAMLRILLDAGCNLDFDMVHSKFKFSGRAFDQTTYELLFQKACRSGKADEAFRVFEEMKTKFTPDVGVYAQLVQCLSSAGKEQLAMEIVKQMDHPGDDVYNVVVMNCVKSGKLSDALEEYMKMLEAGLRPNDSTCIAILTELVVTERTDQACSLFKEMIKAGYVSPKDVYPVVYNAYRKCKVEIVCSFLKDMCGKGCPFDPETINLIVEGLVLRKRVDLARRLFRSVMDAGKKPLAVTYNLFIRHSGSVESSKQTFELMRQNKCKPDLETYHWMIDSLSNAGLYSEAFDLFNEMMNEGYEANAVTYKLVLELLGRDSSVGLDNVVDTLTKLKEKGGFEAAGTYLQKLADDKLLPPKQTGKDGKMLVKILQKDGRKFDDLYM